MNEFLDKFTGGQLIGLIAVVMGPLVGIVAVVAAQWRRVRIAEFEAALKQQMLDKGMSAAEIEQVMTASQNPKAVRQVASTGNEALDKAALVQNMVENGYEGEDIERVLKAYQPPTKQAGEKPLANQP